MRSPLAIGVVGPSWPAALDRDLTVRELSVSQIRERCELDLDALVLHDEALGDLDPVETRRALTQFAGVVIVAPSRIDYETIARWVAAGFTRVVSARLVPGALARLKQHRPHVLVSPRSLVAAVQGEQGAAILDRLVDLRSPRTSELAERLGWSRHRLRRECIGALGLTPRDLLHRWVVARIDALRRAGASVDEIAASLGYSEASAVHHALTAMGRSVPPRHEQPPRANCHSLRASRHVL